MPRHKRWLPRILNALVILVLATVIGVGGIAVYIWMNWYCRF